MRKYCWLVNLSGRRNGFCPIDLAQEHNIRDIKVSDSASVVIKFIPTTNVSQYTFASLGPGVTWEFIGKISSAIPSLRKLKDHFENEWNTYSRYQKHTHPDYQADIERLERAYLVAKLHCKVEGRKLGENHKDTDYVQTGAVAINTGKPISRWQARRKRDESDKEVWAEDVDNMLD